MSEILTPQTSVIDLLRRIDGSPILYPAGAHKWENVQQAYRVGLYKAAGTIKRPDVEKSGTGVVIYGGGKYTTSTYITLRAIREVGYSGPVQIFCLSATEIDSIHARLFADLGAECVNAARLPDRQARRIFTGWHLKPFALRNCRFQRVFAFDADCYPAGRNIFALLATQEQAVLLSDQPSFDFDDVTWQGFGLTCRKLPSVESGFIFVDSVKYWRELEITQWINDHSDYYYKCFYGDKDSYPLAWNLLGTPYLQLPRWCKVDHSLIHHWTDGIPLVVHRCEDKFTLEKDRQTKKHFWTTPQVNGSNVFSPSLPLEWECFKWLSEYKKLLCPCV